MSARDLEFELHVSTSAGFTPSASTLVAIGSQRTFEVGNLDPSKVHYSRIIPVSKVGGRSVRGLPSAELSFTPGRAAATQLNPAVAWKRFPLNGGFETQFDTTTLPDFWFIYPGGGSGVWNTQITRQTSGGISGDAYLKLITDASANAPLIFSAPFEVAEGDWYATSVRRKAVSGGSHACHFGMIFYPDSAATPGTELNADDGQGFLLNTSVGSWVKTTNHAVQAPSGARFARAFFFLVNSGGSGDEVHIDSIECGVEEEWHVVGGSGEPAFANSWVAFGGVYAAPRFKRTPDGWVVLGGLAKSGTIPAAMFTLPSGYRPKSNENVYQSVVSNNALGVLEVQSGGGVLPQVGNNTHFSLEGISFKVD